MSDETSSGLPELMPLPYHDQVVRYLRTEEPDVWRWACSAQAREEHAAEVRASLLKETYRLDAEAHQELHALCAAAAAALGLDVPVTLYQAGDGRMNAALYYLPGEAHVVLQGPVLERLKGPELQALLGHELAHHLLWSRDGGIYHAADRILTATVNDPRAGDSHRQTARRYALYTELFADRGGAVACGDLSAAVAALVKVQTGLSGVSAASYLRQADEVCGPGATVSGAITHPEEFVRARALRLWCERDPEADAWTAGVLQGPLAMATLDLVGQQRLTHLTQRVVGQLLKPRCLRSEGLLAHARQFFPDFAPADTDDAPLATDLATAPGVHAYVSAVLMDFSVADRGLDDVPLAAAFDLAQRLGVAETFERDVSKDLRVPKRRLAKLRQDAARVLAEAEAAHG